MAELISTQLLAGDGAWAEEQAVGKTQCGVCVEQGGRREGEERGRGTEKRDPQAGRGSFTLISVLLPTAEGDPDSHS